LTETKSSSFSLPGNVDALFREKERDGEFVGRALPRLPEEDPVVEEKGKWGEEAQDRRGWGKGGFRGPGL